MPHSVELGTQSRTLCTSVRSSADQWSCCILDLWPFDPKTYTVLLCPKMLSDNKFGENPSTQIADIAETTCRTDGRTDRRTYGRRRRHNKTKRTMPFPVVVRKRTNKKNEQRVKLQRLLLFKVGVTNVSKASNLMTNSKYYSTVALVLPLSLPLCLEWYNGVDNSTGAFRRDQTNTV